MGLLRGHLDRCRRDRDVMCATIGVGFYGSLTLAVLGYSALVALSH